MNEKEQKTGRILKIMGQLIESEGPRAVIGEMCEIRIPNNEHSVLAEVVGLDATTVRLMAYGDTRSIGIDCQVVASGAVLQVGVGDALLGRVLDATGKPCDNKGEIVPSCYYPVIASPPNPFDRVLMGERIITGVRAIDSMLAIAKGQRVGIFAGSGIGKSTLLSMIARNSNADVNVIALVGERGREVLDFIKHDLGEEGLKRSVVVATTSDQPAIARFRGAYVAIAVAEYFRDQGKDVILLFDSVTRFVQAQREIGLSTGELPVQRGYPASVFEMLPKLLERAGTNILGTISGFYNVTVDDDEIDEPIADKVRSILDGHIVLSRRLAEAYHYPAIDVLASISRLANRIMTKEMKDAIAVIRRLMASYAENEDMIIAGAYQKGGNATVDRAIELHDKIESFLMQEEHEVAPFADTMQKLAKLSGVEIN
jgi:flagellum-specific ATP synthase